MKAPIVEVFCEFEFSAAHSLPLLAKTHKCHRVHGHNYKVRVALRTKHGGIEEDKGWVFDYAELDAIWGERVHAVVDHQNLNEVLRTEKTTSEFMAAWIADQIEQGLPETISVVSVEVWETTHFGARWKAE